MSIGGGLRYRADGRTPGQMRPTTIELDVQKWTSASCIIRVGGTHVLCGHGIAAQPLNTCTGRRLGASVQRPHAPSAREQSLRHRTTNATRGTEHERRPYHPITRCCCCHETHSRGSLRRRPMAVVCSHLERPP